ncbi:hypothetical protein A3D11_02135 [Candidatus Peribacteria bacterium RIFCSPHIGHO2_02_FULL_49_16]|nr:MAG: hypothetical protein A2880_02960 [Candidatus Peribacteria bacterium RIFCSPHIGHO2_01_FULL_49_38]OGJ60186.1 MAG: hypothetical protein A3D11_02135 [Candidatus Peribacteria bacterium RIFCSPHIGHO2_02_FULL_49_16]
MPPQEQPHGSAHKLYLIGGVLLILAALAVIGWYYGGVSLSPFTSNLQKAMDFHRGQDHSAAIEDFKAALEQAPNPEAAAQMKEMIAFNLFQRNENNDRAEAVNLFKEIIGDESLAPKVRALALADLTLLALSQDKTFAQQHFSEAPFDYYDSSATTLNVTRTAINMFKASDEVYPNSLAEYGIAYQYAVLSVNNGLGSITPKEAAQIMQSYIEKGDQNYPNEQYLPSNSARQYMYRAIAMDASAYILSDNISLADREAAYKLALSQGGPKEIDDAQLRAAIMDTRFYYANFLLIHFGESRYEDIKQILQPFELMSGGDSGSDIYVRARFIKYGKASAGSYTKNQAIKLAAISIDFKNFLLSLGWKL